MVADQLLDFVIQRFSMLKRTATLTPLLKPSSRGGAFPLFRGGSVSPPFRVGLGKWSRAFSVLTAATRVQAPWVVGWLKFVQFWRSGIATPLRFQSYPTAFLFSPTPGIPGVLRVHRFSQEGVGSSVVKEEEFSSPLLFLEVYDVTLIIHVYVCSMLT